MMRIPADAGEMVGQVLAGQSGAGYGLVKVIPGAAMAYLYLARPEGGDATIPHQVVVKVLRHPTATGEAVEALSEAEFVNHRLVSGHPHIVRVLDWGYSDKGLRERFLVLEYLPGGTLGQALRREWPLARRLLALDRLCAAVEHLHRLDVIHSDIKLGNVLLANSHDITAVRLGDFSVSRPAAAVAGVAPSSRGMRAPEQAGWVNAPLTKAVDIFGLGYLAIGLVWGPAAAQRWGRRVEEGPARFVPPAASRPIWQQTFDRLRGQPQPEALAAMVERMVAAAPDQRPAATAVRRGLRAAWPGLAARR